MPVQVNCIGTEEINHQQGEAYPADGTMEARGRPVEKRDDQDPGHDHGGEGRYGVRRRHS